MLAHRLLPHAVVIHAITTQYRMPHHNAFDTDFFRIFKEHSKRTFTQPGEGLKHRRQHRCFAVPLNDARCTMHDAKIGGGERDRTDDPLLAKQVLSQLSYTPVLSWWVWLELNQRPPPYQDGALTN